MDEETKQLLIERISDVPRDIRELILSDTLTEDIQSISTENGLTEEQRDALQREVRMVLLGVTDLEHFTKDISTELEAESKITSDVVLAVDTHIFSQVRESLNVVHGYAPPKKAPRERADSTVPTKKVSVASDPVAGSILGENRHPGTQSDPYREPIDEE